MKTIWKIFRPEFIRMLLVILLLGFAASCENEPPTSEFNVQDASAKNTMDAGPYEFEGVIYDISATPDGSIMLGLNKVISPATEENPAVVERSIQLIKKGKVSTLIEVETETDIQGVQSIGAGNAFFTTAGSDLAEDGELYRASQGRVRMVADLGKFEQENDPDAFAGPQWKNQQCEEEFDDQGRLVFNAGPQNNPFKVTAFDGETALVADAAGNTILSATTEGEIDLKILLTPPVENGGYVKLFETDGIDCFVQPVPTSVAIGPDGYIYVGELTGAAPGGLPVQLSRVWKLPADATNVVCSEIEGSNNCHLLIDRLTSVIDLEVGPDGLLYVVEYDENSWIAPFIDARAGGTVSAYTLDGELVKAARNLELPSAITFDKKGNAWLLENNIFGPRIRILGEEEFTDAL